MAIVVDTSAFVAIYRNEPEATEMKQKIAAADMALVPASCLVEAALLRRLGDGFFPWLESLINGEGIEVVPITVGAARAAAEAARRYGKGSGHPAQLNFGDCLSFGVAFERALPLLFTGSDFSGTTIQPAVPNPV